MSNLQHNTQHTLLQADKDHSAKVASVVKATASKMGEDTALINAYRKVFSLENLDDKVVSEVAALTLLSALSFHRQLRKEVDEFNDLPDISIIDNSDDPVAELSSAWGRVIDRGYKPFNAALSLLKCTDEIADIKPFVQIITPELPAISDGGGVMYVRVSAAPNGTIHTYSIPYEGSAEK